MPELRKDPVTGRWVIIATERAKRPSQYLRAEEEKRGGFCPFCPGNERSTPSEVMSYRPTHTLKDQEGWWLRVVPNKFPALVQTGPLKRSAHGVYDRITGFGAHEVLIESPNHEQTYGELPVEQVREIIWALRDRTIELRKAEGIRYILIFKNWGREAGASLEHPHTQIIALPVVPKRVQEELWGSSKYFDYRERCVFCDMIQQETDDNQRIIFQNDNFMSYLPFAGRFPFETCIIPRHHTAFFNDITKPEVADLSDILVKTLAVIGQALDAPAYNFMIHVAPYQEPGAETFYHWHIEIIPKLTKVAGFEWGTGFYINPTPPEDAAKYLRETAERMQNGGDGEANGRDNLKVAGIH